MSVQAAGTAAVTGGTWCFPVMTCTALPAARRIARALYFDYSIQDDFYPQFNANTQALWPLLDKML